jgi:peptidoglycan/LPS O-acetylase OafA/YrhL
MASDSVSRNELIDCLRGVAIGVVLLLHFSLSYGLKLRPSAYCRRRCSRRFRSTAITASRFFLPSQLS